MPRAPKQKAADVKNIIDQLGRVKATISDLAAREKELRQQLIELADQDGASELDGELFHVVVSHYTMTTVSWKSVAEAMEAPESLITANSAETEVTKVTINARKG
jgi:hypothetical protein